MAQDGSIRIMGLTLEQVTQFRQQPTAKSSGLYAALDRRYRVVDIVRPVLNRPERIWNRLITAHPSREAWRFRNSLSLWAFDQRTRRAEAALRTRSGSYDLIVQLHTIMAPGRDPAHYRYVLHTDNTYQISERHFPLWAPLRGAQRDAWVQREGAVYRNAAFLFPRSQFLARSLIDDYGCDPARVIVVGGGSNFQLQPITDKRYDRQTALFVGYDFERKGGLVLLDAWAQVRRALPDAQLLIAGPKRPVRKLPGVQWLGRIADRAELARRYQEATLFVLPSLFEPWGHVFFEAMNFGLPCVASTACAMPEIVQDGVTGLLATTGQAEPLAQALIAILGDPARAAQMGQAAQQYVAHGHTWDDVVGRMAPYIAQAVGQTAAPPLVHG